MNEKCIVKHRNGFVDYKSTHKFIQYHTFFLRREMYKCICGKKIEPETYEEYNKYIIAREKALDVYRSKFNA